METKNTLQIKNAWESRFYCDPKSRSGLIWLYVGVSKNNWMRGKQCRLWSGVAFVFCLLSIRKGKYGKVPFPFDATNNYYSIRYVCELIRFRKKKKAKSTSITYARQHEKTYILQCAPNEDSDQPAHPRSLIRVFDVRMKKLCILTFPKSAQWRFWSDCANMHMYDGASSDVRGIWLVPQEKDTYTIGEQWKPRSVCAIKHFCACMSTENQWTLKNISTNRDGLDQTVRMRRWSVSSLFAYAIRADLSRYASGASYAGLIIFVPKNRKK